MTEYLIIYTVVACTQMYCQKDWRSIGEFGRYVEAGKWVSECQQTAKELDVKTFKCVRTSK